MVTVSGNPNPTNPTYPTNPTNPTTKYRCEFVNLFCIYAHIRIKEDTSAPGIAGPSHGKADGCACVIT